MNFKNYISTDSPKFNAVMVIQVLIFSTHASAATLDEIYQKTLQRAESVAVQKILVEQSANNVSRAKSKLAPQLSNGASYNYQGRDGQSSLETSSLVRVGIVQPLFRGGALTSALNIAEIDLSRAKTNEELTRWQVWWSVTQTFYSVLRNEKNLKNLEELQRVLDTRQNEISRRARLGRSRVADQQSTNSQLLTVQAQIQALKTQVEIGRLTLQQMSGLETIGALQKPAPVVSESHFSPQIENRPDIQLRQLNEKRASLEVDLVESNLFPELDLVGNYYPYRNDSFATFQNSLRWEAGLQLRWILDFEELGMSQRKDRELFRQAEELRRKESERSSREEFQRRLVLLRGIEAQSKDLEKAVAASERALKSIQTDFRNGTVSLLDVVTQENSYWEARRQFDTLVIDRDLLAWEILWLEGKAPADFRSEPTEARR